MIATPNRKYHWQLKIIECSDTQLGIGVIQADKAESSLGEPWWNEKYGYVYFARHGSIVNGISRPYGDTYDEGDIIDVWLDLKEDKNELSFAKNGKKFGKAANVEKATDYRLGIAMYCYSISYKKKMKLRLFEITT